jgi:hypothetical protein
MMQGKAESTWISNCRDDERMDAAPLTTPAYWDEKWLGLSLPVLAGSDPADLLTIPILRELVRHVDPKPGTRVLEIGGAPGGLVARLVREFGVTATSVDVSEEGCRKTRENLEILGIDATVVCADALTWEPPDEPFDLVISLGVVEHFMDLDAVFAAHARLASAGAVVAVGLPHYVRLLAPLFRRWAPQELATHNLAAFDSDYVRAVTSRLGLVEVRDCYLGGIQPRLVTSLGFEGSPTWAYRGAALLARRETALYAWRGVRSARPPLNVRLNHRLVSAYELRLYRTPVVEPSCGGSSDGIAR